MYFVVPRSIPGDEGHERVLCLGAEHARSALEGADCEHCEHFNMRKPCSRLTLFDDQGTFISVPRGSGPTATETAHRLYPLGSQIALSLTLSMDSEGPVLDMEAHSAFSSSPDEDLSEGSSFEELEMVVMR